MSRTSKRWNITAPLTCGLCRVSSFQRIEYTEGGTQSNLMVEKHDKHRPSRGTKVSTNGGKSGS